LGPHNSGAQKLVFFFFSNRLGCLSSLLVSAGVTLLLLVLFGWVRF
jgi:hypothetical protein